MCCIPGAGVWLMRETNKCKFECGDGVWVFRCLSWLTCLFVGLLPWFFACMYVCMSICWLCIYILSFYCALRCTFYCVVYFAIQVLGYDEMMRGTDKCTFECEAWNVFCCLNIMNLFTCLFVCMHVDILCICTIFLLSCTFCNAGVGIWWDYAGDGQAIMWGTGKYKFGCGLRILFFLSYIYLFLSLHVHNINLHHLFIALYILQCRCWGMMKWCGGRINVRSNVRHGTYFDVLT